MTHSCIDHVYKYKVINRLFNRDYCYRFNLNPDPKKYTDLNFDKLLAYFKKKDISIWLMKCIPPGNHTNIHYHGMLRIDHPPTTQEDIIKYKKAIAKQITNYIGRYVPLERPDNLKAWYDYIHGISNICLKEVLILPDYIIDPLDSDQDL